MSDTHRPSRMEKLRDLLVLFDQRRTMHEQLLPIVCGGNANLWANGGLTVLLTLLVSSPALGNFPYIWAACTLLTLVFSFAVNRLTYRQGEFHISIVSASWLLAIASALRGLAWGWGLAVMLPATGPSEQLILGWMLAGIMCGGAFSAWSHPLAAMLFSGIVGIGGYIGLTGVPIAGGTLMPYATLIMFAFLLRVVLASVRVLRHSAMAERAVVGQNEVIGLLLRDFEESASDWLWETNAQGVLQRGMERFATVLRIPAETLAELPLISVLNTMEMDSISAKLLGEQFNQPDAFSGVVVGMKGNGQECYLSLSAKPVFSPAGTIAGWRGVASNITEQKLADTKVRKLAHYDSLTGLPNRSYFYDHLQQTIASSKRGERWVFYLDLDGFKSVNDTLGHAVGDSLLRLVAERFRTALGQGCVLARIGGDEFAAIIPGDKDLVEQTWRKLVQCLASPLPAAGNDVTVGVSIGIVSVKDGTSHCDELMRRADVALYRAKHSGRGTARFYDADMDHSEQVRRDMAGALRTAIARREFEVHYQPIHDVKSGALIAAEALLRWNRGKAGYVSPADFIPVAEEAGLISDIGAWVLGRACMDARDWPAHVSVAVNVSPLQFRSHRILTDVTQALSQSGLDPSRLELEITESALIDNVDITSRLLKDLKALGTRLALDDFGTGYSSLSHLHQFQFDKIKIDRSFVQSFRVRQQSAAVVHAVAQLARDLKIIITAEGVETEDHLADMRLAGCNQAQGYLFGRAKRPGKLDFVHQTFESQHNVA